MNMRSPNGAVYQELESYTADEFLWIGSVSKKLNLCRNSTKLKSMKVKNYLKNSQLNVENDIGWLFGLQVLLRKSQKCRNKFSQKIFRETLMMLDTDPILAYGSDVQNFHPIYNFILALCFRAFGHQFKVLLFLHQLI